MWLGTVSYSVYLVHEPLVEAIATYGGRWVSAPALLAILAGAGGIVAGARFHHLVERPCMRPRPRAWAEPRLARLFSWADILWDKGRRLTTGPRPMSDEDSASRPLIAR